MDQTISVAIVLNDETILKSPAEGLWSIASDWEDRWPADWAHARRHRGRACGATGPSSRGSSRHPRGCGNCPMPTGHRATSSSVFDDSSGRVANRPSERRCRFVSNVRARASVPCCPASLYYGNPSGARSGRVPVFTGQAGEEAFYEEHRFPMPYASIEWPDESGRKGAALHSQPCPVPFGNLPDQWWSMGLTGPATMARSWPCSRGRAPQTA